MGGSILDVVSQMNFMVLDEDRFLVRRNTETTNSDQEDDEEESIETLVFDIRTQKKRVLVNPTHPPEIRTPLDVSSSPLLFTGRELLFYQQQGFDNPKRVSDTLLYYDIGSRSSFILD